MFWLRFVEFIQDTNYGKETQHWYQLYLSLKCNLVYDGFVYYHSTKEMFLAKKWQYNNNLGSRF
jgi:hypothetical protein